jgi:hypothetical protein
LLREPKHARDLCQRHASIPQQTQRRLLPYLVADVLELRTLECQFPLQRPRVNEEQVGDGGLAAACAPELRMLLKDPVDDGLLRFESALAA